MKKTLPIFLFCSVLIISACSDEHDTKTARMGEDMNTTQKTTVLSPQLQAIEKAKGVEKMINDTARKHREELDQSTK